MLATISFFITKNKKFILLVTLCLLIPLVLGKISLILGKDFNWDFRNYHYYNAYAFLENRLSYDVAPAQPATYNSPILDIPFYLLSQSVSASTVGFIYGFIHGLNLSLVFLIYWNIYRLQNFLKKFALGILIAVIASTGPGFRSELGGTMNDNLVSLFVLSALLILIISSDNLIKGRNGTGYIQVCIAGLIMGMGVGLKATIGPIALCSGLVLPLLHTSQKNRLQTFLLYGFMGVLGFLITDGFWLWRLYTEFGNPLFPYFNDIFQNPYTKPDRFVDDRFTPKAYYEYFIWPILMSLDSLRVNQLKYSDFRFAFLYISLVLYLVSVVQMKFGKKHEKISADHGNSRFDIRFATYLLAFFICSYIIWMISWSQYRYIIPLELLAPLCIILVLDMTFKNRQVILWLFTFMLLIGAIFYQPFDWGRTDWATPYIQVDTTQFAPDEAGVVIMLGIAPISYVIPDFPETFRFIRPESNLGKYEYGIYERIEMILNETTNPIYMMYQKVDPAIDLNTSMEQLGFTFNENDCSLLSINIPDEIFFCIVTRQSNSLP